MKETVQWYSVDDDMPDDDETVHIFEPDATGDKVWLGYHDADCWRYVDGRETLYTVTHWATMLAGPKPSPQKERQDADEKANLSSC